MDNKKDKLPTFEEREKLLKGIIKELGGEHFTFLNDGISALSDEGTYIAVDEGGDIVCAVVMPNTIDSAIDTLNKVEDWNLEGKEREDILKIVRRAAKFGIVANAVDTLTEIPTYKGWFLSGIKSQEEKQIYKEWLRKINGFTKDENLLGGIELIAQAIIYDMIVDGDFVGTEVWEKIDIGEKKNVYLPVGVQSYDVSGIKLIEQARAVGIERFEYKLPEELVSIVKGQDKEENKEYINFISDFIKKEVDDGKDTIILPKEITIHFGLKKTIRPGLSDSYLIRAIPFIATKERYRALEQATIKGLIQRTIIIKVGHDDPDSKLHIPDPKRVKLAQAMLKNLKPNNLLIWGGNDLHLLDIQAGREQILSFSDRQKEINNDILYALGIAEVLLWGGGSAKSKVDIKLLVKTISMISNLLNKIKFWINTKFTQIQELNKLSEKPIFDWRPSDLYDMEFNLQKVKTLRELNLMSMRGALNRLGEDSDEIIEEMIAEKEEKLAEQLPEPFIPYQGKRDEDSSPSDDDDDDDDDDEGKTGEE